MNISTIRRQAWAGAGASAAILLAACGGGGDGGCPECKAPPTIVPVAGTWRGPLVEATTGSFGEVALTLQQSGATLSGVWTASFNSGTVNAGTITGSVIGNASTADFRLTGTGGCPISVTVSVQSGEAQGTYASVNCPVLMAGSVHVYQDVNNQRTYVPAIPAAPSGVAATAGDGQVTLRWTKVAGASSHNVYWSSSPGVTPQSGLQELHVSEPATITVPASGVPYYFVVTAVNASGEGPASTQVSSTPIVAAPNTPTNVQALGGTGNATVTWPAVIGATGYNLYWSTTPGQAAAGTKVTGVTSGHVLSGLMNGTTYFIAVTATNIGGESASSVEARATPYATTTYNFDGGTLQGWIPSGSWAVVGSKAHSGGYSVTDSPNGGYANYSDSSLESPAIDLAGSASPMLTFWHQYALESGYDWGRVEISTNSGASWTVLKSFSGTQAAWTAETISLEAYSGSPVLIRFHLTSDASNVADGWYLDDIVISR